jgi:hypothetical protein
MAVEAIYALGSESRAEVIEMRLPASIWWVLSGLHLSDSRVDRPRLGRAAQGAIPADYALSTGAVSGVLGEPEQ